ncbi:MAG: MoaD/ThiS family protein [Candidatus Odinarchaeota archaeon]
MAILIKFFGNLAKKVLKKESETISPYNLEIEAEGIEIVADILKKYSIEDSETSHIFVNGIYAGFRKKVKDGDRVGLFPKNMGLLYKWYFTRVEDD